MILPLLTVLGLALNAGPAAAQKSINFENYEPDREFLSRASAANAQCLPKAFDEIYTSKLDLYSADLEDWYQAAGDTAEFTLDAAGELISECGEKNISPYNAVKYGGLLLGYIGAASSGGAAAPAVASIIGKYGESEVTEELIKCVSKSFINASDMMPDAKKTAQDSVDALFAVKNLRDYKNATRSLEWSEYTASMTDTIKALPQSGKAFDDHLGLDKEKIDNAATMFSMVAGMIDRGIDLDTLDQYYEQVSSGVSETAHVLTDPRSAGFLRHAEQALASCRFDDASKNLKYAQEEALKECKAAGQRYRKNERLVRSYYYLYRNHDLRHAAPQRNIITHAYQARDLSKGAVEFRLKLFEDITALKEELRKKSGAHKKTKTAYAKEASDILSDRADKSICTASDKLEAVFNQYPPACRELEQQAHWEQLDKINVAYWDRARDKSKKWWTRLDDIQVLINDCNVASATEDIESLKQEVKNNPTYRRSGTGCEAVDQSPLLDKLSNLIAHNQQTIEWCRDRAASANSNKCAENEVKLSNEKGEISCVACSVLRKDFDDAVNKGELSYARTLAELAGNCGLNMDKLNNDRPCPENTVKITHNGQAQCIDCSQLQQQLDTEAKAGRLSTAQTIFGRGKDCPLDDRELQRANNLQFATQRCNEKLPGSLPVMLGDKFSCECTAGQVASVVHGAQVCQGCGEICAQINDALLNKRVDDLKALLQTTQACGECYERGVMALANAEQFEKQQGLNQQCHEKLPFSVATPIGNDEYQCVCDNGMVLASMSGSQACQTCAHLFTIVKQQFNGQPLNTNVINGLIQNASHCGWYSGVRQAMVQDWENQQQKQQEMLEGLQALTGAMMDEYERNKQIREKRKQQQRAQQPTRQKSPQKTPPKPQSTNKKPTKQAASGCKGGRCGHGHSLYCKNGSSVTPYPRTALDINEDWRCDICNLPFMTQQGKLAPGLRGALRGSGYANCSTSY